MNRELLIEDYARAVARLEEALRAPARDDLARAGCIQDFEFCFELAWKSLKAVLEYMGVSECASPRTSLKSAFAQGLIDDEHTWLAMLAARNQMAHTYDVEEAMKVYDALPQFLQCMKELVVTLRRTTSED